MAFMAWYSRLHYEIKAETIKLTSKPDLFLNDKEKAMEMFVWESLLFDLDG